MQAIAKLIPLHIVEITSMWAIILLYFIVFSFSDKFIVLNCSIVSCSLTYDLITVNPQKPSFIFWDNDASKSFLSFNNFCDLEFCLIIKYKNIGNIIMSQKIF